MSEAAAGSSALDPLNWLAGCREHQESGFRRQEQWMAPLGRSMLGMSRSVAGGKTVEHDVPQRIIYRRLDRSRAVASIEGEQDGLTRVVDFLLSRTDCP